MLTLPRHARLLFVLSIIVLIAACESPRSDDPSSGEAAVDTAAVSEAHVWQELFDGESLAGWRGFRQQDVPDGWTVSEDGAIHFTTSEGDINAGLLTEEEFSDFDLRFEWRVAPGGNSGVFFHVTEDDDTIWKTGPEYQIVDNLGHADGENPVTSAGSNYGLHGPDENHAKPAGEYNEGRVVVRDGLVQHFLNGHKVVEYELGSAEWEAFVADSPFAQMPAYGRTGSGHIALQEGGPVWYRNIRIRRLESAK
jgi:hypothetical protein